MPRIEPGLVPVVTDLERGLRELSIPFAVVGALVPELLLDARPARMTNDADVTIVVQSLADFETLKDRLADFGFTRTRLPRQARAFPCDAGRSVKHYVLFVRRPI